MTIIDTGGPRRTFGDAGVACLPNHGAACLELWVPRIAISALAQDALHVYYATIPDSAAIGSIDKVTGTDTTVTPLPTTLTVTLLAYEGFLYWSSVETSGMTNADISRVPIGGGNIEVLLAGLDDEASLAIAADQLYFAKQTYGVLSVMPLAGGDPEMLLGQGGDIAWLAADGNDLYWIEYVYLTDQAKYGYALTHADTGLTTVETLSTRDLTYRAAISATHIVWYNAQVGIFYALDRRTGEQQHLADLPIEPVNPTYSVVAVNTTHAFAITRDHRLIRAPLSGGPLEELATNLDARALVLDEQYLYAAVPAVGVLRMSVPR